MQPRFIRNQLYHLIYNSQIKPWVDLFFPALCFICENRLEDDRKIICLKCFQQIPKFDLAATDPFPDKKFDTAYILFNYNKSVRFLIHLLKYKGYFTLAEYFAETALQTFPQLRNGYYDYILPVPLHKTRLRERGFNQSAVLGAAIGKKMQFPLREDILIRQRNTPSQTRLNRQQRMQNVTDAFQCPGNISGARILMIDDVITTGSTINACCQTLQQAGVASIDILALANPILDGSQVPTSSKGMILTDATESDLI